VEKMRTTGLKKTALLLPQYIKYYCFFNFNQQMHTIFIGVIVIFIKTPNSYMFRTLLVHHHEV